MKKKEVQHNYHIVIEMKNGTIHDFTNVNNIYIDYNPAISFIRIEFREGSHMVINTLECISYLVEGY